MLASVRRLFGISSNTDPFRSVAGNQAGPLMHTRPIGAMAGLMDGSPATDTILAANWVKTLGSGTITTVDGHPATIQMVTAATGDAVTSMEQSKDFGTTVWKPCQMSATDKLWARFRINLASALNGGLLLGFSNSATSNIFGTSGSTGTIGSGITDFVGFWKAHNTTTLSAVVRKASTSTTQTLTGYTLADATYALLDVVVDDGTKEVNFYFNGVNVFCQTTTTNFPLTSTNLTLRASVQTNTTTARTLTLQRAFAWQESQAA